MTRDRLRVRARGASTKGRRRALICLALGFGVLVPACGGRDKGAAPVTPDAADLVARGWARFEAEDLDGARSAFEEAESLDPAYAPAPHGLGWALLRLGELRSAQEAMTRAAARGFTDPDLDAARALVARDLVPVEWSQARQAAERVLLASALYRFNHDPTLDWRDLRLLIAQASFVLGDYPRIAAEIVALGQTPPDPSDSDYAAALLQQLQDLGTALGSSGRYP